MRQRERESEEGNKKSKYRKETTKEKESKWNKKMRNGN